MRPCSVCLLSLLGGLTLSSPARSQALDRVAAADALFEQGRTLVEAGSFAEACPRFLASEQLDPGVGTLLWLADCYAGLGRTASAWTTFGEAAAAASRKQDRRAAVALAKRDELEKRLSRLTLRVRPDTETEGLQLLRDGAVLGRDEWNVAIPIDPGTHVISASASRRRSWTTSLRIATGPANVSVTVPVLEPDPEASAPPSAHDVIPTPEAPADAREGLGGQRWSGIAAMGLGGAGVIVGTIWALDAKATYDQSTAGPCSANNVCTQTGLDERSSARTLATAATVAIGVGAAAMVTGVVLFFTAPQRAGSVAVAPAVWPAGASVTMSGAF